MPSPQLNADRVLAAEPVAWQSQAREIGRSRENRPIFGFAAGSGKALVTLIGGCHADEPVGPALLEQVASHLASLPSDHALRRELTWRIVPHVNPDGEARNREWTEHPVSARDHRGEPDTAYDLAAYLGSVARELPGDDIEFGFPARTDRDPSTIRPENLAVAEFLAPPAADLALPISLHGSFHGMGLSPGPWFLIERSWTERTKGLRKRLRDEVVAMGYRLFDAERHGEKGFDRIGPGFTTRPDSVAMRAFFEARGEPEEAAKFRPSSMEFAQANGDDPLTFVPEMPLFQTPSLPPGLVERCDLEAVRTRLLEGMASSRDRLRSVAAELGVVAFPIRDQMKLQLALLNQALYCVVSGRRQSG